MRPKQPKTSQPPAYHHGDLRRALIDAALALVTEEQDWTFSLREVARRAGVSHNAPYNHFADKRDLLAAVAAAGFATLGERIVTATSGIENAQTALVKSALVYVSFGVENPAHYRLMFSSALITAEEGRPAAVATAGAKTRAILANIIRRGAVMGIFDVSLSGDEELHIAVLSAWSTVHGLTILTIDGVSGVAQLAIDDIAEKLASRLCYGLVRRQIAGS
jgi:AcrR family transcriptional regulator